MFGAAVSGVMEDETERRADPAGSGGAVRDRADREAGAGSAWHQLHYQTGSLSLGLHEGP